MSFYDIYAQIVIGKTEEDGRQHHFSRDFLLVVSSTTVTFMELVGQHYFR